jgi:hypothetical protein
LRDARASRTSDERAQARRLARMMEGPRGNELAIALTDQAFRSRRPEHIADQIAYLLVTAQPSAFSRVERSYGV